jgi:type II secretory pathway component PulF
VKKFNYEAKDKANNEIVKSIVQADSETSAAKVLIEQGLMPLNIKEVKVILLKKKY